MSNNITRPATIVFMSLGLTLLAAGSARAEGSAQPGQKCRYDFASRAMVCDNEKARAAPVQQGATPSVSARQAAGETHTAAQEPALVRIQGLPRGTYLEVRARPSSGDPVIAYIPPDDGPIKMLGCGSGHWCRVEYRGQTGFARRHFLARIDERAPSAQPHEQRQATADVLLRVVRVPYEDTLNVRQFPSMDSPVVGELPADARRIVLRGDCQDDWCPIEYEQVLGWAGRHYLTRDR